MVNSWFRFVLRQAATALVLVTTVLLLSEILLPSSVLPYFNLHVLVLVTFLVAVVSPMIEERSRLRVIMLIPIAVLLLAYAWFSFGMSASGVMLFGGLGILVVGVMVALVAGNTSPQGYTSPSVPLLGEEREVVIEEETIIISDDGIEIDETSVFMR